MPISLRETRSRTFHGTKRRIFHLLEEMGTSATDLAVRFSTLHAFARTSDARQDGGVAPRHACRSRRGRSEDRIVWRIENEGFDGTHGFYLTSEGKETTVEYRVEAILSDTDGRLTWRRFEDQFERAIEALFDKLTRVLKR